MIERPRPCICGSGKESEALYDARGIYVSLVCDDCRERVKGKYRKDIFTDDNYWTDEPIDEDY